MSDAPQLPADDEPPPDRPMTRREIWRLAVTCFLASLIISGAALALAVRTNHQQDKGWCELIIILDAGYRTPPGPQTPAGKVIAAAIAARRQSLHCDN